VYRCKSYEIAQRIVALWLQGGLPGGGNGHLALLDDRGSVTRKNGGDGLTSNSKRCSALAGERVAHVVPAGPAFQSCEVGAAARLPCGSVRIRINVINDARKTYYLVQRH
jgi:hypothetical protein